jgi:NADH-quinone oxidoreductase subunit H
LGWKVLVPFSLVWLLLVAALQALRSSGRPAGETVALVGIPVLALLVLVFWLYDRRAKNIDAATAAEVEAEAKLPTPYPVPPMDLVVPPSPRLAVSTVSVSTDAHTEQPGEENPGV